MKKIEGGITAPNGFKAAGCLAGIKAGSTKYDMAMILCDVPAATAIVATQNQVKAAPVLWDVAAVREKPYQRAVVINSGNANACTGELGKAHVKQTAEKVAQCLGLSSQEVLVSSTGVIGVPMPIDRVLDGVAVLSGQLTADMQGAMDAATAMMTTDKVPKTVAYEFELDGKHTRIAGMAKGSGMICPNMATMLAYVTTDADVHPEVLQRMLSEIVQGTFNMMSVDGDMSTNDTLVAMASGLAGNVQIVDEKSPTGQIFYAALYQVCEDLAKAIVRDGEGATKLLECRVSEAATLEEARILAKACISSSLVKTAMFGCDANWGRVLSSIGAAGIAFDPGKVSLWFESDAGRIQLLEQGMPIPFDESLAKTILEEKNIIIDVLMGCGTAQACAWGCDLTYEYVTINADYRT